jgi:hypothetical protein
VFMVPPVEFLNSTSPTSLTSPMLPARPTWLAREQWSLTTKASEKQSLITRRLSE